MLKSFIRDNGIVSIRERLYDSKDETDFVVDYPVLFYADCLDVEQKVMMANLGINCA
jgi:hypothetical protein